MARPQVDVVVPFRGSRAGLEELRARLARLRLGAGDSLVVVDNTPGASPPSRPGPVPVLHAAELATPGYARNRGAARGSADWLLFLDADVLPPPDLADLYFQSAVDERTALLAGGVRDEAVPPGGRAVPRYAHINKAMSQERSFGYGPEWGFAQTANVACLRAAFAQVGGFSEGIRAGEDADLNYRLRRAGWRVERREAAAVVHRNRQSVRAFAAQRACHGSAAAWLAREYPGAFPARRRVGLVWWGLRHAVRGLLRAARRRDRDEALMAVFDPLEHLAYEFGRSLPNERPLPPRLRKLARM